MCGLLMLLPAFAASTTSTDVDHRWAAVAAGLLAAASQSWCYSRKQVLKLSESAQNSFLASAVSALTERSLSHAVQGWAFLDAMSYFVFQVGLLRFCWFLFAL